MKLMDMALRRQKPIGIEERRSSLRFPLGEEVAYRFFRGREAVAGSGRAINMSSGGLLFATRGLLPEGQKIQVTVNWPVLLDDGCRLKVVASGRVVRSDARATAIRIEHYEFHTRASRLLERGLVRNIIAPEFEEASLVS